MPIKISTDDSMLMRTVAKEHRGAIAAERAAIEEYRRQLAELDKLENPLSASDEIDELHWEISYSRVRIAGHQAARAALKKAAAKAEKKGRRSSVRLLAGQKLGAGLIMQEMQNAYRAEQRRRDKRAAHLAAEVALAAERRDQAERALRYAREDFAETCAAATAVFTYAELADQLGGVGGRALAQTVRRHGFKPARRGGRPPA